MKIIKRYFYLFLTEFRFRQFLKEMGIYISFKRTHLSDTRELVLIKIENRSSSSPAVCNVRDSISKDYLNYQPMCRRTLEIDYFNTICWEFKNQVDTIFSFSACKTQKRFFQFIKLYDKLKETDCQTQLKFPQ